MENYKAVMDAVTRSREIKRAAEELSAEYEREKSALNAAHRVVQDAHAKVLAEPTDANAAAYKAAHEAMGKDPWARHDSIRGRCDKAVADLDASNTLLLNLLGVSCPGDATLTANAYALYWPFYQNNPNVK
jgi:hypothetical protein